MTDRFNYLTVALEKDIRGDDAAGLIAAIKMLRGVLAVEPNVTTPSDWNAQVRARQALVDKISAALWGPEIGDQ